LSVLRVRQCEAFGGGLPPTKVTRRPPSAALPPQGAAQSVHHGSRTMNERANLHRRAFLEALAREGDPDPNNYAYAGGSKGRHLKYFLNLKVDAPRARDACLCEHFIVEQCYIRHNVTQRMLVVGNCCIKRYIKACYRTCERCRGRHRSVKDNFCKPCRDIKRAEAAVALRKHVRDVGRALDARQEADAVAARVYLKVPYEQKDAAKALGAKWDGARKHWFAPAATMARLVSSYARVNGVPPVVHAT
jgi:hypothetical protein